MYLLKKKQKCSILKSDADFDLGRAHACLMGSNIF